MFLKKFKVRIFFSRYLFPFFFELIILSLFCLNLTLFLLIQEISYLLSKLILKLFNFIDDTLDMNMRKIILLRQSKYINFYLFAWWVFPLPGGPMIKIFYWDKPSTLLNYCRRFYIDFWIPYLLLQGNLNLTGSAPSSAYIAAYSSSNLANIIVGFIRRFKVSSP